MNNDRIQNRVKNHNASNMGQSDSIKTAVMIPLTKLPSDNIDSPSIIFERRAEHLDVQPGDICFPGGFCDSSDSSARETALRETSEELGINSEHITIWSDFDSMLIPWQLEIKSFVGWVDRFQDVQPDETEVDEVFTVSLQEAINQEPETYDVEMQPSPEEDFPYERIPRGRDYNWRPRRLPEYFYDFNGRTVWGITARFLKRFLEVLSASD